ncbi:unnamed protein product [Onchocerca flexuosa]|uniref:Uncharacterized protein n=1 Tax=Onchocerca flexuosa TaxID=387005 RepID=A0A183HUE4_9BILA|nr:unnamed protein product [Onchocerca flexuosa]
MKNQLKLIHLSLRSIQFCMKLKVLPVSTRLLLKVYGKIFTRLY